MTTPQRIESVHWSALPQPPESVLALTRAFALLGAPLALTSAEFQR
ncbi:hypothetical protein [Streptomyces mirabilis]